MSTRRVVRPFSLSSATPWVAALALVPFASLPLPPPQRLPAQALLFFALLAAQGPWLRKPARPLPTLLRFGLAAWLVAAAWGSVVGLISGNPLRYLAGQSLAMLMLPLAALVFWSRSGFDTRSLLRGLAIAVIVALALHLLLPVLGLVPSAAIERVGSGPGAGPVATQRLRIVSGVSFVGTALLVLLLCAGGLRGSGRGRWLIAAGTLSAAVLVIGGFSRGQWVSAVFGLTLLVVTTLGAHRRVWYAVAGASGALALLAALYALVATDPVAVPGDPGRWQLDGGTSPDTLEIARLEWTEGRGATVSARVDGPRGETLRLWTEARPAEEARFRRTYTRMPGTRSTDATLAEGDEEAEHEPSRLRATIQVPEVAQQLRVGVWISGGAWTIEELRIQSIDSRTATWLQTWLSRPTAVHLEEPSWPSVARMRMQQLIWALADPTGDDNVRYRTDENAAVKEAWQESGWLRRLAGAGLGATVDHAIPSFDAQGQKILVERTSYLHNYYLFLAFKLGLFGLLPLAAMGAFAAQAWRLGRRHGWLGHAAFAAWLSYALWSLSSPEILDFRRAVLWGLLIAACGRAELSSVVPTAGVKPSR